MRDLDERQIIEGLRLLAGEPDPVAVSRRVIAKYRKGPSGESRWMRAAAVATLVLVSMVGFFYLVPAAGLALASDSTTNPVLQMVGLGELASRITSMSDTATQGDVTARLLGGYADNARTVILIDLPPSMRIDSISLRDQFMQTYRLRAVVEDLSTGHAGVIFDPIRGPSIAAGARLTTTIDQLRMAPAETIVPGPWQLQGVLVRENQHRTISSPQDGEVGGQQVHIDPAVAVPYGLKVRVAFPGADSQQILATPKEGPVKGRPPVILRLVPDSSQSATPPFMTEYTPSSEGPAFDCLWLVPPGHYSLVVDYMGNKADWAISLPAFPIS